MNISALGVVSSNIPQTIKFYVLLEFEFPDYAGLDHLEAITKPGETRLMIDSESLIKSLIHEDPKPANHATFAIEYPLPRDVDTATASLKAQGHTIVTKPWDAFWGQRYAVVADPDGYRIDLFTALS